MGRIFVVELEGRAYRCKFCKTHLALADDLISRAFHCRRGKAYLFNNAANITVGPQEERMMLSGMHTVADIFCCCCGQIVGWKYVLSLSLSVLAHTCICRLHSNTSSFNRGVNILALTFSSLKTSSHPGGCTRKEPEVQRRKVCSRKREDHRWRRL